MKRKLVIIILVLLAVIVILPVYIFTHQEKLVEKDQNKLTQKVCLSEDEKAEYKIDKKGTTRGIAKISIKKQKTDTEIYSFQIDNVSKAVHALEMYKCNIYVIRVFNFDDEKGVPLPNYRTEFWQYNYDGNGKKIIDLFKKEGAPDNYGQDFHIDPLEIYISFERKYLGDPNYAIVIKDLETREDAFVLTYDDLINKYSAPEGGLSLGIWRDNGKCFGGSIHIAAKTLAFFRIERDTWKTEVFIVPEEALTVDSISESGEYITYDNGPGWIGIHEHALQVYDEWREQGKQQSLIIYNLFTKERIILETIDDPSWSFKPKWLSNTELEYELPTGEKKIYKIND